MGITVLRALPASLQGGIIAMGKRKRLIFTAIAVALLGIVTGLLPGCTPTPTPTQAANEVIILGRAFIPMTITVTAGTTVTWTNQDPQSHVVTSDDGLFFFELALHDSFSYTFTEPGTFTYYGVPPGDDLFDAKVIVE
jgi:plastocyanin